MRSAKFSAREEPAAQIPSAIWGFRFRSILIRPADHALRWEDVNYFQNDFGGAEGDWDEWLAEVGALVAGQHVRRACFRSGGSAGGVSEFC